MKTDNHVKYKGAFDIYEDSDSDKFDGWHKNQSMLVVPKALKEYYINNIPVEETILKHTDIYDFCKAVKGIRGASFKTEYYDNFKKVTIPQQKRVNRYIVSNTGVKLIKTMNALLDENGNNKRDQLLKHRRENPQQLDLFNFVEDVVIDKNRDSEVEAGKLVTMMNRITSTDISTYDINYQYYIDECYKFLNQIKSDE